MICVKGNSLALCWRVGWMKFYLTRWLVFSVYDCEYNGSISLKWNIVHVSWVTYKSVSLQGREPRMIRELVKRSGKRKWNVMLLVRFPTQIYHVRNYLCLLLRNILLFPWGSIVYLELCVRTRWRCLTYISVCHFKFPFTVFGKMFLFL